MRSSVVVTTDKTDCSSCKSALQALSPSATLSAVTAEFSECSSLVKGIEGELARENEHALAALVRDIQERESSKLQLTVKLQTLKKSYSEACRHEGAQCECEDQTTESVFSKDVLYRTSLRTIFKELELVIRSINENIEEVQVELEDRTEEVEEEI